MFRNFALLFIAIFVVTINSFAGDGWTRLPCEDVNQSDIVFVGRVLVTNIDESASEQERFRAELLVEEPFIAATKNQRIRALASLHTADYVGLISGKSFFIYAGRRSDGSGVTVSGISKPVNKAAADLGYLRRVIADSAGSSIFGRASFYSKSSVYKDSQQPISSIKLKLLSKETNEYLEMVTDESGNYKFEGLQPGLYSVQLASELSKAFIAYEPTIMVRKFGCHQTDVEIRYDLQVKGAVVDAKGSPVAKVPLELIPVDYNKPRYDILAANERTASDDSGNFTISNVPPGRYHLAVNYTTVPERGRAFPTSFYPGTRDRIKAQVIEVEEGRNVEGLLFTTGSEKLSERKITGRVLYSNGRPVPNADVYLKEDENQVCCVLEKAVTDPKGNFVLAGYATRKYRIWTHIEHKPFTHKVNFFGASPVFSLDSSSPAFTIVVRPTYKHSLDALDEIETLERRRIK